LHHAFEHRKALADPFRLTAQAGFSPHPPVVPVTSRPDEVSANAYLSQQADITCETVSAGLGLRPERSHLGASRSDNVILFLHHRYRTAGGEEQAIDDLLWLVRTSLGEDAELLERDSAGVGRARAARGLVRGGLDPGEVARAVRRTGARIVHAHN